MQVTVPAADVDVTSGRLWALGVAGIEEFDAGEDRVRLVATVAPTDQARVIDQIPGCVAVPSGGPDRPEPDRTPPGGDPGPHPYAPVTRVGRWVIAPPWADAAPAPGQRVVSIDPGSAFGHGGHPTTRMTIGHLDGIDLRDLVVDDLGCGSGVVAIVAALAGARAVRAVDVDPAAVAATRANAAANGVGDVIEVVEGDAAELDGEVDVAVVNVTIDVHEILAPAVAGRARTVVAAGVLDHQLPRLLARYPGYGWEGSSAVADWVSARLAATSTATINSPHTAASTQ